MGQLDERVATVAAAGFGIGRLTVIRIAGEKADVAVTDLNGA
jgi:NAD(P)-dependent dehydrogenase (short-subunit alcohol dehydrogenase family)